MKLGGSYTFAASREDVWQLLMDPTTLQRIIPGCERLEATTPTTYAGAMNLRISNVRDDYNGTVTIIEQYPPERYRLAGEGVSKTGFAKVACAVELVAERDGTTKMHYLAETHIGGPVASIGQPMIEASLRSLINQSLKALRAELEASRTNGASFSEHRATVSQPAVALPSPSVTQREDQSVPSRGRTTTDRRRGVADDLLAEQPWTRRVMLLIGGCILGLFVGMRIAARQE